MNIENIKVGEIFTTTSKLINKTGNKYVSGKKGEMQKSELERYLKWESTNNPNKPNEIIVTEIYDIPKEKYDGRINNGGDHGLGFYKNFNGFLVDKDNCRKKGVYKIQLGNDIYIGSTIASFRNRFLSHRYGNMQYTKDLLDNGGEFSVLWVASIDDTEDYIRAKEEDYIQLYKNNAKYNLINRFEDCWCIKSNKSKSKIKKSNYTYIRVNKEQIKYACDILNDYGIDYINNAH